MDYNVYIDESGDEGLKRGSDFFLLTAVIVEKKRDLAISKTIDEIKKELQISETAQLHWNKIKGLPNKKMVINRISLEKIIIVNVIIDTREMKYIPTKDMYYHFVGYLLGKVCDVMRYKKGIANLNISARSQLNKKDLIDYLKCHDKMGKIRANHIRWDAEHIKIYPNSQKKLLQMADCCCSSLGQAIKYNDVNSCNVYKPLISKAFKYKNEMLKHGFMFIPISNMPTQFLLMEEIASYHD